jgi:hypothetical protein
MAGTYEIIGSTTLGSNQTNVSFTSIPSTYTDLVVISVCAGSSNDLQVGLIYNDDTGLNYSITELFGSGSTTGAYRAGNQTLWSLSADFSIKNTLGNSIYKTDIFSYANTGIYKTGISTLNSIGSTYPGMSSNVGMWRNTAAITKITMVGAFLSGSSFNLYGVKAA